MIHAKINIKRVISDFGTTFEATFCTNKKAHFDSVPPNLRVVDGAKSRWCNPILIDGLIYLSELREINESSRRSFNQQQVLYECILREIKRNSPEIYEEYTLGRASPLLHGIQIEEMVHPWEDLSALRRLLLADPTTKSKEKFIRIVDTLLHHTVLHQAHDSFHELFKDVAEKVLFFYNPLSGPSCLVAREAAEPAGVTQAPVPSPVLQLSSFDYVNSVRGGNAGLHSSTTTTTTTMTMTMTSKPVNVGELSLMDYAFDSAVFDDLLCSELDNRPWDYLESLSVFDECEGNRHRPPALVNRPNRPVYYADHDNDDDKRVLLYNPSMQVPAAIKDNKALFKPIAPVTLSAAPITTAVVASQNTSNLPEFPASSCAQKQRNNLSSSPFSSCVGVLKQALTDAYPLQQRRYGCDRKSTLSSPFPVTGSAFYSRRSSFGSNSLLPVVSTQERLVRSSDLERVHMAVHKVSAESSWLFMEEQQQETTKTTATSVDSINEVQEEEEKEDDEVDSDGNLDLDLGLVFDEMVTDLNMTESSSDEKKRNFTAYQSGQNEKMMKEDGDSNGASMTKRPAR